MIDDMRFRVLLNSQIFNTWYSRSLPLIRTKIDCGLRVCAYPFREAIAAAEQVTHGKGIAEDVGASNEGGLVGRRGLVGDLAVLGFGNDGVAGRELEEELVDDAGRLVAAVEVGLHLVKGKDLAALVLVDDIGIGDSADRALPELHLIAGQCARLVREDVLDLAELFDEGRCPAERRRVGLGVVHVEV
jgi:hypothetical protein